MISLSECKPTLIDSRFGDFHFEPETHTYTLGTKVLPGITGILKSCGDIDTTYFTEEARVRGSNVHKAIHFLNKGTLDWSSVVDQYLGYVSAYEKLVKDWNIKLEMFEVPLFHPEYLFAGTPDVVCRCLDNTPGIFEIKTGIVQEWTRYQTAGQELLTRAWDGVRRRRWAVTLNKDGTYSKPKEYTDWQRDEVEFLMRNSIVQNRGF